jgi:N,N-dimethylformamidase
MLVVIGNQWGSLVRNAYANNVSRITDNVIRRFLDPKPFPGV